jgi:hypothetical protein
MSHTPLLILPPELWEEYALGDRGLRDLVFPPAGYHLSFDDAVATTVPASIRDRPRDLNFFRRQSQAAQDALDRLAESLRAARPDVVVIISDDQDEWFYENNMPAFAVYWGPSAPVIPRPEPVSGTERRRELARLVARGYGARRRDIPVDSHLGRHLVERLMDQDFDVAQLTYPEPVSGGRITRRFPAADGEDTFDVESPPRSVGLPHGYSFVIERLMGDTVIPILPVFQNTCYPPNAVTPRRCLALGQAMAKAFADWEEDVRIAVVASGGLSHFVVDEEIDRELLGALAAGDDERLRNLPTHRLRSATSECLNWVTLAGVLAGERLPMELLAYEPVYRTEAGTGAGLGFARWVAP